MSDPFEDAGARRYRERKRDASGTVTRDSDRDAVSIVHDPEVRS
jgi:hypothetical protein